MSTGQLEEGQTDGCTHYNATQLHGISLNWRILLPLVSTVTERVSSCEHISTGQLADKIIWCPKVNTRVLLLCGHPFKPEISLHFKTKTQSRIIK